MPPNPNGATDVASLMTRLGEAQDRRIDAIDDALASVHTTLGHHAAEIGRLREEQATERGRREGSSGFLQRAAPWVSILIALGALMANLIK